MASKMTQTGMDVAQLRSTWYANVQSSNQGQHRSKTEDARCSVSGRTATLMLTYAMLVVTANAAESVSVFIEQREATL